MISSTPLHLTTIVGYGGKPIRLTPATAYWFEQLREAGRKATPPVKLDAASGYRTEARQKARYEYAVKKYGPTEARKHIAPPGKSKHNLGTGIDLFFGFRLTPENAAAIRSTREWQWLAQNLQAFGFRFYDSEIEPWHIELEDTFQENEGNLMADNTQLAPVDLSSPDAKAAMDFLVKQGWTAEEVRQLLDTHVPFNLTEAQVAQELKKLGWSMSDVLRLLAGPAKAPLTAEKLFQQFAASSSQEQGLFAEALKQAGVSGIKLDPSLLQRLDPAHLAPTNATDLSSMIDLLKNLPDAQKQRFLSLLKTKLPNPDIVFAPPGKTNKNGGGTSPPWTPVLQQGINTLGDALKGLLNKKSSSTDQSSKPTDKGKGGDTPDSDNSGSNSGDNSGDKGDKGDNSGDKGDKADNSSDSGGNSSDKADNSSDTGDETEASSPPEEQATPSNEEPSTGSDTGGAGDTGSADTSGGSPDDNQSEPD